MLLSQEQAEYPGTAGTKSERERKINQWMEARKGQEIFKSLLYLSSTMDSRVAVARDARAL